MGSLPRDVLPQELSTRGRVLLDDPRLLKALLRDLCGEYQVEIEAILAAQRADTPANLQKDKALPLQAVLQREVTKLRQTQGLDEAVAQWGVETWAVAIGRLRVADCTTPPVLTQPGTIARRRAVSGQSQACIKLYDRWKTDLFDFSRRNPLLYFKPTATSTLEITQPNLHDLFDRIAIRARALSFPRYQVLPMAPAAQSDSIGPRRFRYKQLAAGDIQCDKIEGALLRSLANLRNSARASRNELGLNSLYIGFGLLEWVDPSRSGEKNFSPLVLAPVDLVRKRGQDEFQLTAIDDDVIVNPTLRAYLESPRFSTPVRLPDLTDIDNGLSDFIVESKRLAARLGWNVVEKSVLRIFSFQTIRLGEDFDEAVESGLFPSAVRKLAGERLQESVTAAAPAEIVLDELMHPREVFQVLDADESQVRVISESRAGTDMVIDGPPGTGKSQTIVNLIAQAVNDGRTVLFVSQKKAALEIVYKRLHDIGLDKLCLQVHSDKANKRAVLDELKAVYQKVRGVTADLRHNDYDLLYEQRRRLNEVAKALNAPIGDLRWSIQSVHGRLLEVESTHDATSRVNGDYSSPLKVSAIEWQMLESAAQEYVLAHADSPARHTHSPWRDLAPAARPGVRTEIQLVLARCTAALGDIDKFRAGIVQSFGLPPLMDRADFQTFLRLVSLLKDAPTLISNWFEPKSEPALRELIARGKRLSETIRSGVGQLEGTGYSPAIFELDLDPAIRQITADDAFLSDYLVEPFPVWDSANRASQSEAIRAVVIATEQASQLHGRLGKLLEIVAESTLSRLQWFKRLLDCMGTGLRPLEHWFEPGKLASVKQVVSEASERTRQRAQAIGQIHTSWAEEALHCNPVVLRNDLEVRFRSNWRRWFSADYKAWLARFQNMWKGSNRLQLSDIRSLLKCLEIEAQHVTWLLARESELMEALGENSAGFDTDFSAVLIAIEAASSISELFAPDPVPETVRRVLLERSIAPDEAGNLSAQLSAHVETIRSTVQSLQPLVKEAAWPATAKLDADLDLVTLHGFAYKLQMHTQWLVAAYDAIRQRVLGSPTDALTVQGLLAALKTAQTVVISDQELRNGAEVYTRAFGSGFQSIRTDWDALSAALDFMIQVRVFLTSEYALSNEDWFKVAGKLSFPTRIGPLAAECMLAGDRLIRQLDEALEHLQGFFVDPQRRLGVDTLKSAPYEVLAIWFRDMSARLDELPAALRLASARQQVQRVGLADLVGELEAHSKIDTVGEVAKKRFYRQWLEAAYQVSPEIQELSIGQHRQLIQRFASLDRELIEAQRLRTLYVWQRGIPALSSGVTASQAGQLARELNKRTRHIPLRQLFGKIPDLLPKLKPCVLMSPLSVAAYLPLNEFQSRFDLVIFDEASQVRPAFAGGAMLRGKQVIIAGDMQQLPPTDFFRATVGYEDDEFDDEAAIEQNTEPGSLESILGEFLSLPGVRRERLRWHYRSRNEALIQFSNQAYYNGDLVTFPSPARKAHDQAIRLERVNGVYDRGRTRQNQAEAQHVINLIRKHLNEHGEGTSLGVIALSMAQEQAIRDHLQAQLDAGDMELSRYSDWLDEDAQRLEPFFIKALERVQGDERDAIIISVGYGPDAQGAVKQYFGPLAIDGGERRLNVAITRAKQQLTLVTSLRPEDIKIGENTKAGVLGLRRYIEYCGSPNSVATARTDTGSGNSAFEVVIERELTELGYTVDTLVGLGSMRLDLAVVHPEAADRYLAGIHSDGIRYGRIKTARDRDRLRSLVLRDNLGWSLIQVWSREWLDDPSRARRELAKQLDDLRRSNGTRNRDTTERTERAKPVKMAAAHAAAPAVVQADWRDHLQTNQYQFYKPTRKGSEADFVRNFSHTSQLIQAIVQREQPIHIDLLFERLVSCYNMVLSKGEARPRFEMCFEYARKHGYVVISDSFVWPREQTFALIPRTPPPRHEARAIAHIALEELGALAMQIARANYGIERKALASLVSEVMGYKVLSKLRRNRINLAIDKLAQVGHLSVRGESIFA